jgi:hypothetical protein
MRALVAVACLLLGPMQAGAASNPWTSLRRPLHLPHVARGTACPVSHVDRRVDWKRINIFGGAGIGAGPVYPGLRNAWLYATEERYGGPWAGEKVFWYVSPSYRGPVLIRGHRLDGAEALGFNGRRQPASELRIGPRDTVTWQGQPTGSRGVPSDVRVRADGCYGVQIDGTTFSRVVVFTAEIA